MNKDSSSKTDEFNIKDKWLKDRGYDVTFNNISDWALKIQNTANENYKNANKSKIGFKAIDGKYPFTIKTDYDIDAKSCIIESIIEHRKHSRSGMQAISDSIIKILNDSKSPLVDIALDFGINE